MHAPRLLISFQKNLIARLHKKNLEQIPVLFQPVQCALCITKRLIRTHVQAQRHLRDLAAWHGYKLHKFLDQRYRQVIHTVKAHVFQHLHSRPFTGTAHPGHYHKSHFIISRIPCISDSVSQRKRNPSYF